MTASRNTYTIFPIKQKKTEGSKSLAVVATLVVSPLFCSPASTFIKSSWTHSLLSQQTRLPLGSLVHISLPDFPCLPSASVKGEKHLAKALPSVTHGKEVDGKALFAFAECQKILDKEIAKKSQKITFF